MIRQWKTGDALDSLSKSAITKENLRDYAKASLDHNRIHLDESFAKEAGFPSVIVHGMMMMAFLGDLVRRNFPEHEYDLVRFDTRFRRVTFPGDEIFCEGSIKKIEPSGLITLSVSSKNQKGETTADGQAVVRSRQ